MPTFHLLVDLSTVAPFPGNCLGSTLLSNSSHSIQFHLSQLCLIIPYFLGFVKEKMGAATGESAQEVTEGGGSIDAADIIQQAVVIPL